MGVSRHIKNDENSCYMYCNMCGDIYDKLDNVSYDEILQSDKGVSDGWYSGGPRSNINLCPKCAMEMKYGKVK